MTSNNVEDFHESPNDIVVTEATDSGLNNLLSEIGDILHYENATEEYYSATNCHLLLVK